MDILVSLIAFILAFPAGEALAHSRLRTLEAERTGLDVTLSAGFSSPLEFPFCRFTLKREGSGNPVPLISLNGKEGGSPATLLKFSAASILPGQYVFHFSILSTDGHRLIGSRPITIE